MSIRSELLALVERINDRMALPKVRRVYIPEPHIAADKDAEFGLIELDDGAAGLFYAWMGESQRGISERYAPVDLVGADAITVAHFYGGDDDIERSLGLAVINAITQSFFERANLRLEDAANSMGGLSLRTGDRLGMIGNFPSLVRQAQALGIPVTVVERKTHMIKDEEGVCITLDPAALAACNKIISTAATLINDSVDQMLGYCGHAETLVMIGPSASFFPDPLFARGVDFVGGTRVLDPSAAVARQREGIGLGDSTRRYTLSRATYPGTPNLGVDL
jgi:uncharacterized protein